MSAEARKHTSPQNCDLKKAFVKSLGRKEREAGRQNKEGPQAKHWLFFSYVTSKANVPQTPQDWAELLCQVHNPPSSAS